MCQNTAGRSITFFEDRAKDERYAEGESAVFLQAILGPIQTKWRQQRFSALVSDQSDNTIYISQLNSLTEGSEERILQT
jgi:hypothetical protein